MFFQRAKSKETRGALIGRSGFGAPLHLAFERRPLPGAGAMQWAYETLTLPMDTPIGWGVANQMQRETVKPPGTVLSQRQGVTLTTLGNPGIISGQFVTQPLVTTNQSQMSGIDLSSAVLPGSFMMPAP